MLIEAGDGPCRSATTGLDLNAVLLDFGLRFVFRFGREAQENRQNKTKNNTKTKRKTTFRASPGRRRVGPSVGARPSAMSLSWDDLLLNRAFTGKRQK